MADGHGSVFAQFAKTSNSKRDSVNTTDESPKQSPRGVVLGKDGKPYVCPPGQILFLLILPAAAEHVPRPPIGSQ
jgi:hypothetical protein